MWIPPSVEVIGVKCFAGCPALADVTFAPGSHLTRMGKGAFGFCSSLTSICIPASVLVIEYGCFDQCHSLHHVGFEAGSRTSRLFRWYCTSPRVRRCCEHLSHEGLLYSLIILVIALGTIFILWVLSWKADV
jgi:hypothetical protein